MSNKTLAFIIAAVYVVLATIYSHWAVSHSVSDGVLFYFFFPASIIPSLIFFAEREPMLLILICQTITLLIFWLFCWMLLASYRSDR